MTISSKLYAEEYGSMHESVVSKVLSIASICGALRFFWSFLLEKYSYKKIYGTLVAIQVVVAYIFPTIIELDNGPLKTALYGFSVCVSFNTEGGHFVLLPTILAKIFGANGGIRVFSVAYSFIGIASLCNVGIYDLFFDIIGFKGICYINATFSLISLLILIFVFKEERVKI